MAVPVSWKSRITKLIISYYFQQIHTSLNALTIAASFTNEYIDSSSTFPFTNDTIVSWTLFFSRCQNCRYNHEINLSLKSNIKIIEGHKYEGTSLRSSILKAPIDIIKREWNRLRENLSEYLKKVLLDKLNNKQSKSNIVLIMRT